MLVISYANEFYTESQKKLNNSLLSVDKKIAHWSMGPNDIDVDFFRKYQDILTRKKGAGYWLWKPYLILKALNTLNKNDILYYCDSGAYFIKSPRIFEDIIVDNNIICYDVDVIEKHWTKQYVISNLGLEANSSVINTKQRLASFMGLKKNDMTIEFMETWLKYCVTPNFIDDFASGAENHEYFRHHRHDQSLFSITTKLYNFESFRDPSQFGNRYADEYTNSPYPQIIHHTRENKLSWDRKIIRSILPKIEKMTRFIR